MEAEALQTSHRVSSNILLQKTLTSCKPFSTIAVEPGMYFCRFPGGLKERSARLQFDKDPTEILRKAVYGMLPKNKLRDVCPAASKAPSLLMFVFAHALQGASTSCLILYFTVITNDAEWDMIFCVMLQARARKLRIFPDEGHPFEKHPQLVAWEMPPRKLRANKEFYDLPEEYEPMNPEAYRKRFWHMMNAAQQQRVLQYQANQQAGSEAQQ